MYDVTDYRATYDLYLTAFGDKQLAAQARTKALESYVEAEIRAYNQK